MLAIVSLAFAGPNLLPGADPVAAGAGDAHVGVFALGAVAAGSCSGPDDCSGPILGVFAGPVLSGRVGLTDRVAAQGAAAGVATPDFSAGYVGGALAVRALVVDGARVRVAPWIAGMGAGFVDLYAGTGGIALDVGGDRVRFDLSVPVVALAYDGRDVGVTAGSLLASEVGFAWMLGRGHAVRVGMWSLAPGLAWSWAGDRWTADVAVHSLGLLTLGQARLGVRF
ncbi:MAG: hypothetical protein ACOZNI_01900 [Myxococcota bacterium]